jgi:uncharacterized protein YqeY
MIRAQLDEALKTALRARDECAVTTVRLVLAALKDRDIAERSKGNHAGIADDQILTLLQSMIKQRRESIELYKRGRRDDLAKQEAEEITVIERFLPPQMGDEEMRQVVSATIEELEAKSLKDMGRVMGTLKSRHAGQMDFAAAGALVKARLG